MARYNQPEAGEWVQPVPVGYKFACCDCGLTHRLDFAIVNLNDGDRVVQKVRFRAFRDNRATAAVRRERRKRETTS